MKTTRQPFRQAPGNNYAPAGNRTPQDFFGKPKIYSQGTRFSLVPESNGRSGLRFNMGALSSAYFSPGSRKRFKGVDGSALPVGGDVNPYGALGGPVGEGAGVYPNFGKPSFDAVGTIGFMSNHLVPGNMTYMRSIDRADEVPGLQDVAILRVSDESTPQRWTTGSGMLNDETPRDAWTLPGFNRMLALNQKKITSFDDLAPTTGGAINWHDPVSILSNFYVYGIVNDSDTTTNRTATPRVGANKHFSGSEERKSGVTISGRDQCFRLWGPDLPAGVRLFFILKPVKRATSYITNAYHYMFQKPRSFTKEQQAELEEHPFQLVPFAGLGNRPPAKELLYVDAMGVERTAPYILFGTVYKQDEGWGGSSSRTANLADMSRDLSLIRQQGLIDIIVHV